MRERALARLGVEVRTSTPLTGCDEGGVGTTKGRIDAATIIWAAGVVASPAAQWLGVTPDRAGRVEVAADLTAPGHANIFVIGDTAAAPSGGKPAPGIAPAAKQMGRYAGQKIEAALKGKELAPFRYRHEGDLATIGRKAAVVKLDSFTLTGFAGWLFWGVAHIYFLIGLRNRFAVAFSWLWDRRHSRAAHALSPVIKLTLKRQGGQSRAADIIHRHGSHVLATREAMGPEPSSKCVNGWPSSRNLITRMFPLA